MRIQRDTRRRRGSGRILPHGELRSLCRKRRGAMPGGFNDDGDVADGYAGV